MKKILYILMWFCYSQVFSQLNQIVDGRGKIGFIDNSKVMIVNCQFDWVQHNSFGSNGKMTCIVRTEQNYGLLSADGKFLVPMTYSSIYVVNSFRNLLGFEQGGKHGLMDLQTGKILMPAEYDKEMTYSGSFRFLSGSKNGKWGAFDNDLKIIVPFEHDNLLDYSSGILCFQKKDKVGFYDGKGKEIIPFVYDELGSIQATYKRIRVKRNGKWGIIDYQGKELTPFIYDDIGIYSDGLAYFELNKKVGFLDIKGKVKIPAIYDQGDYFEKGLCFVGKFDKNENLKYALIDKKGKNLSEFIFDDFYTSFESGHSIVIRNGRYGAINTSGGYTIELQYEEEQINPEFDVNGDYFLMLRTADTVQLYSPKGLPLLSKKYDEIEDAMFEYDRAVILVRKDDQMGYLRLTDGKELVPCKYTNILPYEFEHADFVKLEQGDKKGVWSLKQNREVIPVQFDNLEYDYDYPQDKERIFFRVWQGDKIGIWDVTNNRQLVQCAYDEIQYLSQEIPKEHYYVTFNGDSLSIVNIQGQVIIPERLMEYPEIRYDKSDLYFVIFDLTKQKFGLYSSSGKELLPCSYTEINAVKKGVVYVDNNGVSETVVLPKK